MKRESVEELSRIKEVVWDGMLKGTKDFKLKQKERSVKSAHSKTKESRFYQMLTLTDH